MAQDKAKKENTKNQKNGEGIVSDDSTVEVLYQKMGDRWFAFSLVDDEVFVGSISPDQIDADIPKV